MICNEIQPIPEDWQKRPIIRQYNASNELIVRTYGKTEEGTLCQNCPDYQTPVCATCPYSESIEPDGHTCPICGGHMEGDDYTTPRHCENVEVPMDVEADSGPYYCEVSDGIYPNPDSEDIPF
jgi:hypothetical protein